jgi:hypothetical protein
MLVLVAIFPTILFYTLGAAKLADFVEGQATWLGVDLVSVLGVPTFAMLFALTIAVLVIAPAIVVPYRVTSAKLRERLARTMTATAPSTPNGLETCRKCGAPLPNTPEALGVRCGYCGADNLIAVTAWLTFERGVSLRDKQHTRVDDLLEAEAAELATARRRARKHTGWATVVTAISTIVVAFAVGNRAAVWGHCGSDLATSQRMIALYGGYTWHRKQTVPLPAVVAKEAADDTLVVALRRGEVVTFASGDVAAQRGVAFRMVSSRDQQRWDLVLTCDGEPLIAHADFVAPYEGWFRVVTTVAEPRDSDEEAEKIGVEIRPPGSPPGVSEELREAVVHAGPAFGGAPWRSTFVAPCGAPSR